jgi:Glycosyl hydrolase family 26
VTYRRPRTARRGVVLAVAAAVIVVAAAATATSLGTKGKRSSRPIVPPGVDATARSHSPSATDAATRLGMQGPAARLIPKSGAYLGAYVQPASYTPAGEIAAVRSFQQTIGASMTLVHTYHPWDNPFPDQADRYFVSSGKVLLLTWGGTPDTKKIIAGSYDAQIRARAEAVKRLGGPILMEFRHEMDRPNLQWAVHGPQNFIAAWDHIRAIFARAGALNVGWVWCPTGWGFRDGRAQAFYPGDSKVDWVCADIYSVSTTQTLQEAASQFLGWARHTHKPVLIGEFAVNGEPWAWSRWLLAAGALVKLDPQIKGMAYFDANGTDSQGRPFQYWLGSNPQALRAFGQLLSWSAFRPVLSSSQ